MDVGFRNVRRISLSPAACSVSITVMGRQGPVTKVSRERIWNILRRINSSKIPHTWGNSTLIARSR